MRKTAAVGLCLIIFLLTGCGNKQIDEIQNSEKHGSMKLEYATQFTVDFLENDTSLVSIADGNQYLIVSDNSDIPADTGKNVTIIHKKPENAYIAASSSMDFFNQLGLLDNIKMTSTKSADWCIPEIQKLVDEDIIAFVGKYSTPDYEYLVSEECDLAVESTMVYHSPEVKEKLEALGIPVLIERSSYESHPLGRLEWIKLYGLIFGVEDEAEKFYDEELSKIKNIEINSDDYKPSVAFFSISSNGYAVVRKPDDYIAEMIRMSGGEYIFSASDFRTDENALSTVNMQMESFYSKAEDADIIIYNSAIDGGVDSLSKLLEKDAVFSDFKAVKNGNVWCTEKNVFQKTTAEAEIISDFNLVVNNTDKDNLSFMHRLS